MSGENLTLFNPLDGNIYPSPCLLCKAQRKQAEAKQSKQPIELNFTISKHKL
jgi:hypothetical protein